MTLADHRSRFHVGQQLRCVDHWIPSRIGQMATVKRVGATVADWESDGKPYRSEYPKASELVRSDDRGYRVETTKPDGRPMFWEWEFVSDSDPIDVCASCGQTLLTTPDDPSPTLFCDACLASLEARRVVRPNTIAANPPQGGLF